MAATSPAPPPPRHAWEWFARQRLLWRGIRRELAAQGPPVGPRYRVVDTRTDVVDHLRRDYPVDHVVRTVIHQHIDAEIFLGHAHRGLEGLGIRNAPRGLRWWWATITDTEQPETPTSGSGAGTAAATATTRQLALDLSRLDPQQAIDDVHFGWGD